MQPHSRKTTDHDSRSALDPAPPPDASEKERPLGYGDGFSLPPGAVDTPGGFDRDLARVRASTPADVRAQIDQYSPASLSSADSVDFCRTALFSVAPKTAQTVVQSGAAITHLVNWAHRRRGLPLKYRLLFSGEVISQWQAAVVASGDLAEGTTRNYRGHLRRVAHELGVEIDEDFEPLSRTAAAAPYSHDEIERYRLWARSLATALARARATAILTLAAGCGLTSAEIVRVRRRDVIFEGGMWVLASGPNARVAPVTATWRPQLRHITERLDGQALVFPREDGAPKQRALAGWLASYPKQHRPEPQRLRATWIVEQLRNPANDANVLAWSGIERGETLAGYLPHLGTVDSTRRRAMLRLRSAAPLLGADDDASEPDAAHRDGGGGL